MVYLFVKKVKFFIFEVFASKSPNSISVSLCLKLFCDLSKFNWSTMRTYRGWNIPTWISNTVDSFLFTNKQSPSLPRLWFRISKLLVLLLTCFFNFFNRMKLGLIYVPVCFQKCQNVRIFGRKNISMENAYKRRNSV